MARTCSKCGKKQFREIDRETNTQGKTYVLLECASCKRSIILPQEEADKATG